MIVEPSPGRVAIVGLGLIGGSLARALRRLPNPPETAASSNRTEDLERAISDEVVQRACAEPRDLFAGASLVIYATPVEVTLAFLEAHRNIWPADAVVMDVGSVKRQTMARARILGLQERFVGAHPMAGSERSGYAASRADMFDGARVWVCSFDDGTAAERVFPFWRAVGGEPARIEPDDHDRLMARISHLPQVIASALGLSLRELGVAEDELGPGGRDMTRLAASTTDLWTDLLLRNADMLAEPIAAVRDALDAVSDAVERGDRDSLAALLNGASEWRGVAK